MWLICTMEPLKGEAFGINFLPLGGHCDLANCRSDFQCDKKKPQILESEEVYEIRTKANPNLTSNKKRSRSNKVEFYNNF